MSLYIIEGKLNTYRFFNIYYVEDWYANIVRKRFAKIIGEGSLADCFISFLRLLFCIYTIIHNNNNNNNNFVTLFFFNDIRAGFDWPVFYLKFPIKNSSKSIGVDDINIPSNTLEGESNNPNQHLSSVLLNELNYIPWWELWQLLLVKGLNLVMLMAILNHIILPHKPMKHGNAMINLLCIGYSIL